MCECVYVCVLDWGWPLSARCVTSAAALSPANGALVEPRKESPAEALLLLLMLDQHQRKSGRMTTVGPPSTRWLCFALGVTERSSIETEKRITVANLVSDDRRPKYCNEI